MLVPPLQRLAQLVLQHMALGLLLLHRHQQLIQSCGEQHLLPLLEDSGCMHSSCSHAHRSVRS